MAIRCFLALLACAASAPSSAASLQGSALVIDGDTLEISNRRVRLFGIDAPELSQSCDLAGENWACGAAAADELRRLIGNSNLTCQGNEFDIYARLLAVCYVDGVELNRTLVMQGWATAFRRYSNNYVDAELQARASRIGLWSSNFVPPEDFRQAEDQQVAAALPAQRRPAVRQAPSECRIKGNRNSRGEWIYHLPWMEYYSRTRAEEMFCTEAEAQAAGYRRSRSG